MSQHMMTGYTPYQAPKLPSLMETLGPGGPSADPATIFKLLSTQQGRASDVLPSIQELLMGTQAPAIESLREGARANRAMAQSDAMRRGLTASDIELASMTAATEAGESQVGQLIAQQSSQLAQYIMQAMGMDIQGNREMFVTLAQALGQELGSQRDMQMQRELLQANMEMARRRSGAQRAGGLGSLLGTGLGAGAGALLAAPTGGMSIGLGALLGGGLGGSLGQAGGTAFGGY